MTKKVFLFVLFCLLLLGTIRPFFMSGFFPMHDDTQVARVYEMGRALQDGMFPVRWVKDLGYGYGYPLFTFYAPFSYYVGGIFVLLGLPALLATKVMMGVGVILSGIGMYFLGRSLWGEKGGLLAGILYTYATYHAVDIYVRGDVAEFWAYALLPFIVYGMLQIHKTRNWLYVVLTAIAYGALISAHNLSAMMVTPFIIVWGVVLGWKSKMQVRVLLGSAFLIGLLLAGFYWLPVFTEMHYTNVLSQVGGGADFHDHFVCLQQFWSSPWGFGGSVPGCIDGLSFMVGKVALLLSGISLVLAVLLYRKQAQKASLVFLFAAGLAIALFLATSYSLFIWNGIKTMAFFQYPWRFLFLASFFSALLGGATVAFIEGIVPKNIKEIAGWIFSCLSLVAVLFFQTKLFAPQQYFLRTSNDYTNRKQLTWETSKTSDEYMPPQFKKPKNQSEVPQRMVRLINGSAKLRVDKTQYKEITLAIPSGQVVQINQAFFPGWIVRIDGKDTAYQQTPTGISVLVPAGNHVMTLEYHQTTFEVIGDLLSITGILILVIGIIYSQKRSYGKKS